MTTDDVLARLGLETRKTATDYLLPALGVFGAGLVVGAGVALMLAPKSGSELRGDLGRTARRVKSRVMPRNGTPPWDEMTRDELYERAQALDIEGRSVMSKDELLSAVQTAS
jgi:hypothetical protein